MNSQDHSTRVPIIALIIAFLIPIAFAGTVMLLLAQAGPHDVVLAGVPRDVFRGIEVASVRDAAIPVEAAVGRAKAELRDPNDDVGQVVVGRYGKESPLEQQRGLVVWLVSFANPRDISVASHCGLDSEACSCNWAYHPGYVVAEIDARTGNMLGMYSGAGFVDPSIPPTGGYQPTDEVRERCETYLEEARRTGAVP
jgi:hypothetical protein